MPGTPLKLYLCSRVLRLCPPWIRGKARLARAVLGACRENRNVYIHDRYGCTFLVPSLHEPIAFHLLVDGIYEPMTAEFLLGHLGAGATFVDVGANIGVFTVPVARRVGPAGRVLAVEGSPRVFPYLEHNVRINGISNVRLKHFAAYDHDVQAVPFYEAPIESFGMGALAPQFHDQATPVPALALDTFFCQEGIDHVDLLKIDVEGFEAAVFRGAKELLTRKDPPLIVFEFCDWAEARVPGSRVGAAQQLLNDWGYQIWRLSDFGNRRRKGLKEVLRHGFEMLVAIKE